MRHARTLVALAASVTALSTGSAAAQGTSVEIDVTPVASTAGALGLRRVELLFPNDRGEITVKAGTALVARAVIDYAGSGVLSGRWLVDGRPHQEFLQTLTFGAQVALAIDPVPGLPTFEPGRHEVTLQISSPLVAFTPPVLRYVVEASTAPGEGTITLLEPAEGTAVEAPASSKDAGARFSWTQTGLPASSYRIDLRAEGVLKGPPALSAIVPTAEFTLSALQASALTVGERYRWQVTALAPAGAELAVSAVASFTLTPAGTIRLLTPADGARVTLPASFAWALASRPLVPLTFEVRLYRNETALDEDLRVLRCGPPSRAGLSPLCAPTTPGSAPLLVVPAAGGLAVEVPALPKLTPGLVVRWVVVAYGAGGVVAAVSGSSGFVVEPTLGQVNGLPKLLDLAGFTVEVTGYGSGAAADRLTGSGLTRLAPDRTQAPLALAFAGLAVTTYVERTRTVSGSGPTATTTITEVLRGAVTRGSIDQPFSPPLALDLAGYPTTLARLVLRSADPGPGAPAGALEGAWASLRLQLPAYVAISAGTPLWLDLHDTRLEAGGRFYRELDWGQLRAVLALTSLGPARLSLATALVADFSAQRDYLDASGQPVPADGLVLLADAQASLPAGQLLPVLEDTSIRLTGSLPLTPGELVATLAVAESDPLHPVVPGGYELVLTGGAIGLRGASLDGSRLTLDGRVRLPDSVRRPGGGAVIVPFHGLVPAVGWLRSRVDVGDLEWTTAPSPPPAATVTPGGKSPPGTGRGQAGFLPGAGGTPPEPLPFRLLQSRGELALPFAELPAAPASAGLLVDAGTLDSPLTIDRSALKAALPEDAVALRVGLAGVSGTITTSDAPPAPPAVAPTSGPFPGLASLSRPVAVRARTGRLGDFKATVARLKATLQDSAVVDASVDGDLVVPRPVDLTLPFTGASLTATGELLGPSIAQPAELPLAWWRTTVVPGRLLLSRSFLRVEGGSLRFDVDAQFGPRELSPLGLRTLDLGADGQIRAVATELVTDYVGIPFTLGAEDSLAFATWTELAPTSAQALVTMPGVLALPTIGGKTATVQHTPSGGAVSFAFPSYERGNPELIHVTGDLAWTNGYPKGKPFKEFLGLATIDLLQAAQLHGMVSLGLDPDGVYERYGLGLSADAEKVAELYQTGGITLAAKLGAGVVALASGSNNGHVEEVTSLVTGLSGLVTGKFATGAELEQATLKLLGQSIRLAKIIHLDAGGKEGDDVATALDLGSSGLSVAAGLVAKKGTLNYRETALLILTGLDAAFPILSKADFAKDKDTQAVLAFIRLGVRGTRFWLDGNGLTEKEIFALSRGLAEAARPLSGDPNYQLVMDIVAGVFQAAESATKFDDVLVARIGGGILSAIRRSGTVQGNDWNNALTLAQALLDAAVAAKDLPSPDKWIFMASSVLEAAGGTGMNYGSRDDQRVKVIARMAARTLQAVTAAAGGIPSDKAAAAVKDAYDSEFAMSHFGPFDQSVGSTEELVRRLLDTWSRLKGMPLNDVGPGLALILCEASGTGDCANPAGFEALVAAPLSDAMHAASPGAMVVALKRLAALGYGARPASLLDGVRPQVATAAGVLGAKATTLATTVVIPGIAAAASIEEAGRLRDLGKDLNWEASRVKSAFGLSSADLDLGDAVAKPVDAALAARLTGTLATDVLARLPGVTVPREVVNLWAEWKARAGVLRDDDPVVQRVSAAFLAKAKAIRDTCQRRVVQEFGAIVPIVAECLTALVYLPQDDSPLSLGILPVVTGNLLGSMFVAGQLADVNQGEDARLALEHATALIFVANSPVDRAAAGTGTGYVEAAYLPDEVPKNLVRAVFEGTSTPPDATYVDNTLGRLVASVRAGWIDASTLLFFRAVEQAVARLGLARPEDAARLAEVRQAIGPVCDVALGTMELDIATDSPGDAVVRSELHVLCSMLPGKANTILESRVPGWVAKAKAAPCSKRLAMRGWLWAVAPWVPTKYPELKKGIEDLDRGCLAPTIDPAAEAAAVARAGDELKAELLRLLDSPAPEPDKKEQLGWFIAERVKTLSDGQSGERPEERVLRAVHQQVTFVLDNRQKTRVQRVAAVAKLLAQAVADVPGGGLSGLEKWVPLLEAGLTSFVAQGGENMPPWHQAITLASSLVNAAAPDSKPVQAVVGSWLGLLKTYDPAKDAGKVLLVGALPAAVTTGLAIGIGGRIKTDASGRVDVAASFAGANLTGEPWKSIGTLAPEAIAIVESAGKLQALLEALQKSTSGDATTVDRLAALRRFTEEAPKLGVLGPLAGAVLDPVAHLKAPDTDLGEYGSNLLLAELGEARSLVPGAAAKPAESTCATIAVPGATLASGTHDTMLCVVDVARRIIRGLLARVITSTTPLDQVNAQAAAQLAQIRQDAIFAPAAGDEHLSGLAGGLEYRAGVFRKFELYASFDVKPVLNAAVLLDYDALQQLLTLRLASADPRPPGRMAGLGLAPGANSIMGTSTFQNPIRTLDIQVDGRRGCADGKVALALSTPLGGWQTMESRLGLCWTPFSMSVAAAVDLSYPPFRFVPSVRFCAGNGRAGLDLDEKGGIFIPEILPEPVIVDAWGRGPYVKYWGLYAMAGLGLGFSAGPGSFEIRGRASAEVGVSVAEKDEPNCLGTPLVLGALFPGDAFDPTGSYQSSQGPIRYGICRSGFGAKAEFRAGQASATGFFLKGQTLVDLGLTKIGFWTYNGAGVTDGGAGTFPTDRYGGWPAASLSPLSTESMCGAMP